MGRHLTQYKTHRQEPLIGDNSIHGLDPRKKDINNIPNAEATIKGHIAQTRKNEHSTTTNNNSGE